MLGLAKITSVSKINNVHSIHSHDAGVERAPYREGLKAMSPERVLAAMESGAMVPMAGCLSAAERRALTEFLTGKTLGQTIPPPPGLRASSRGESGSQAPYVAAAGKTRRR
jgi:hypothetical protein